MRSFAVDFCCYSCFCLPSLFNINTHAHRERDRHAKKRCDKHLYEAYIHIHSSTQQAHQHFKYYKQKLTAEPTLTDGQ